MDRRSAVIAVVAALGLLVAPATARPVLGAEELRLTVASTYTLDPADRTVHVVMDVTATNLKPNRVSGSIITSYYYNELSFGIQEEAKAIRATSGGSRLSARATRRDRYQALSVRLARNLNYRQTQKIRITFDLPGGAPRSESDIRVGEAFSSFYAWAWGDPGRAGVTIAIPAGFDEDVTGSPVTRTSDAKTIRLTAKAIADPDKWFVTVDAERPASLTTDHITLAGGARLTVRAWPEDAEWRTKVHDLVEKGLPILQRNIGLDWPVEGDVGVFEVHTPLLEGYAGVYYTDADRIEIGEDLDDLTIIHEASHAWFNGDLFAGRWISEGFADEYASLVLRELGLGHPGPDALTPVSPGAVRLIVWQHPGRIVDKETDDRESYGYNASWTMVRGLVDEIGVAKMRDVIRAAEGRKAAYRGAPAPETVPGAHDWRRFLDLLEEVGGATKAEALFRRWVTQPGQDTILDQRAETRKAYEALLEAGDGWLAPFFVRSKLDAWAFERAQTAIDESEAVIASREAIEVRATTLGLTLSGTLETAYEGATVDLEAARSLADEQIATLDALTAARATLGKERDAITTIGLIGTEPERDFADATAAFEADDLAGAAANAAEARTAVEGAADVGRTRAVTAGAATGGALVLGAGAIFMTRRRRKPRVLVTAPTSTGQQVGWTDPDATAPYATLPGDPAGPSLEPPPDPPRLPDRGDEPPWSSRL
jgi:hypothetical protein